jgi:hypothetical protein
MELQVKARDMNEIRKVSMLLENSISFSAFVISYSCIWSCIVHHSSYLS